MTDLLIRLDTRYVCANDELALDAAERIRELEAFVIAEGECHISHKEIKRLEKRLAAISLKANLIERRYLPCPDHRDKHKTGDECLMCQLERVQTGQTQ